MLCSLSYGIQSLQSVPDIRMAHEQIPDESTPVILDHDGDWSLIKPHENRRHPVLGQIESVAEAIFPHKKEP